MQRDGQPIRFDSVGGKGQIPNEVLRRIGAVPHRPRLVTIIDSDRKTPAAKLGSDARKLRRICDRNHVPCWILERREAENYLPKALLIARPNTGEEHRLKVAAWERLSDDQRNFIDMKRGLGERSCWSRIAPWLGRVLSMVWPFRSRSTTPLGADEALFATISSADRAILSKGFGQNVYECWCVSGLTVTSELVAGPQNDLCQGIGLIRSEV